MSGGAWNYLSNKLADGDFPVAWIAPIQHALADIEHTMDWAVSGDTSKGVDELVEVWDRLVELFNTLSHERIEPFQ